MKLQEHFTALNTREWDDTPVSKLYDVEVVQEYHSVSNSFDKPVKRWPGTHKNVYCWVVLANGKAVGWNESASRGYSFPVITYKDA